MELELPRDSDPVELLEMGLDRGVYTGASLWVHSRGSRLLGKSCGALGLDPTNMVTESALFDLASLTKALCVAPCWMLLKARDRRVLGRPLSEWFPQIPKDKAPITPRDLLAHCSGLPHWRPYYLHQQTITDMKPYVWARIFREDLIGAPGEKVLYSDLGFIMLHNILELETGEPLQDFYRKNITDPLHITDEMMFKPDPEKYDIVQTSENDPPGVVNDLNARAMGGISGHAGLFGTARGVARIGMEILNAIRNRPSLFDHFTASGFAEEVKVRGRTMRPMGFDSANGPNPSCGRNFSRDSIGHTGFTGTSLWIDPVNELIVALLTNRVLLGETNTLIKEFRPAIHEAIFRSIQAPLHQAEGY